MLTLNNFDAGEYKIDEMISFLERLKVLFGGDCLVGLMAGHNNISMYVLEKGPDGFYVHYTGENDERYDDGVSSPLPDE